MESKKNQTQRNRGETGGCQRWGWGELGEGNKKI